MVDKEGKLKKSQSTKQRNQKHEKTVGTPKINKTDTVKSLDKSNSTQINDTKNTLYKSISIPRSNYSNKSTSPIAL